MKNLTPIIAGITLPVFFTESTHAQNKQQTVPAAAILKNRQPDTVRFCALMAPQSAAPKNTAETEQPSSLIQAVNKYTIATGDRGPLFLALSDKTILQGMERALKRSRFGRRMVPIFIKNGFIQATADELKPMTDCVIAQQSYYEWQDVQTGTPKGSRNAEEKQAYYPTLSPC